MSEWQAEGKGKDAKDEPDTSDFEVKTLIQTRKREVMNRMSCCKRSQLSASQLEGSPYVSLVELTQLDVSHISCQFDPRM
jgi:hypothetical protein